MRKKSKEQPIFITVPMFKRNRGGNCFMIDGAKGAERASRKLKKPT